MATRDVKHRVTMKTKPHDPDSTILETFDVEYGPRRFVLLVDSASPDEISNKIANVVIKSTLIILQQGADVCNKAAKANHHLKNNVFINSGLSNDII